MHFTAPAALLLIENFCLCWNFLSLVCFLAEKWKSFSCAILTIIFIASRHPPNMRLPLLLDQKQEKHFYTSTVASRDLPSQNLPNSLLASLLVGCVQETPFRADKSWRKRSNYAELRQVTIVDDRKSVLTQAESQLNAIEKPHSEALPKYFPYLWNLLGQMKRN